MAWNPAFGDRRELVAPGVGELGEAVGEDDGEALALLVDGDTDAVGFDKARLWPRGGGVLREGAAVEAGGGDHSACGGEESAAGEFGGGMTCHG